MFGGLCYLMLLLTRPRPLKSLPRICLKQDVKFMDRDIIICQIRCNTHFFSRDLIPTALNFHHFSISTPLLPSSSSPALCSTENEGLSLSLWILSVLNTQSRRKEYRDDEFDACTNQKQGSCVQVTT